MKKIIKRKTLIIVLILMFVTIMSMSLTTSAAVEKINIWMFGYPRSGGSFNWGHGDLAFMNNWYSADTDRFYAIAASNKNSQIAYCVQPGVGLSSYDEIPVVASADYLESYDNGALNSEDLQKYLGRVMHYGYNGVASGGLTNNEIAQVIATQILVWEIIVGERNPDFSYKVPTGSYNAAKAIVRNSHPLRTTIFNYYDEIVDNVINHKKRPSFMEELTKPAPIHEMTWDGSAYSVTIPDKNEILRDFNFLPLSGITITKNGNNLTISSTAPISEIDGKVIYAERDNSKSRAVVFWGWETISDKNNRQGLILGTEIDDPVPAHMKLKISTGNLDIKKTTQHNNGSVGGFDFEVRDSFNNLIGTFTSDANGNIHIPNLAAGVYTVKEINLSSDFVEPTPNPKTVTVYGGQTAEVSFDNIKKRGIITIQKNNANPNMGDYPLAGAVFEVRNASNTLVDTITTNAQGRAQTIILPLGTYTVTEVTAPYGYIRNPSTFTVTISGSQGTGAIVYPPDVNVPQNPQPGIIRVEKFNANPDMGCYSLAGAVYEVKAAQNILRLDGTVIYSQGELVDTITTNAQGRAQTKQLPLGAYTVQEVIAPFGYVINPTIFDAILEYAGQDITVTYTDVSVPQQPVVGRLIIEKTGEVLIGAQEYTETIHGIVHTLYNPVYGVQPLPGAVYEIYVREDILRCDGTVLLSAGTLVDTITTGSDGKAMSVSLPLGNYYVVEITAPFGMILNPTEYDFSLVYEDQTVEIVYTEVGVYNERQKVEVPIIKKWDLPNRPPPNYTVSATFGLFARTEILARNGSVAIPKDGLIKTITLTVTGGDTASGVFDVDLPFGSYYVEEMDVTATPPHNYFLDNTQYDFTFEYAGQNITLVTIPINGGTPINNRLVGTLPIKKIIHVHKNFEHATGTGIRMSEIGITNGQNWEEFTPITISQAVNSEIFSTPLIIDIEGTIVGTMTAKYIPGEGLMIGYEVFSGYHLQQDARLQIVHHPSVSDCVVSGCTNHFTSKSFGDLPFRSDNYNNGQASGYIMIDEATLLAKEIIFDETHPDFDIDQEFYVFLRLSRVAGGLYNNINRSWIDAGYKYEFMVFDLDDFSHLIGNGKPYPNQKAVEQAVANDVIGVLNNGVMPVNITRVRDADGNAINSAKRVGLNGLCAIRVATRAYSTDRSCDPMNCTCWSVFAEFNKTIWVDLPQGRYLIAEIFRDENGVIMDSSVFVTTTGTGEVSTVNPGNTSNERLIRNNFKKFYHEVYGQ
ncbi:MAG: SpaA isopeptide-forming pilin-related protein [Oscillospiraceae bacterium]|nr:SpaA isopeptide-forming pilin-related protein [Oscillospiraceae bacterium]